MNGVYIGRWAKGGDRVTDWSGNVARDEPGLGEQLKFDRSERESR